MKSNQMTKNGGGGPSGSTTSSATKSTQKQGGFTSETSAPSTKAKKTKAPQSVPTLMPGRIQQTSTNATGNLATNSSLSITNSKGVGSKQQVQQAVSGAQVTSGPSSGQGPGKGGTGAELLVVTVIPVDEQPYSKHVQIPLINASAGVGTAGSTLSAAAAGQTQYGQSARSNQSTLIVQQQNQQYPSLKDLFQNSDQLWRPIFGSFVGANKKPQFAIFRKPIERRGEIAGIKRDTELSLHILYLKRDITQFPRNAFANQIEVYCSKFFYGPLVVVFCDTKPPYKLHDFPPYYLIDEIEPLNELEQKCYPLPFGAKRCSLVRALMAEERFTTNLENLERVLSNHEFMLYCYKTSFCPISNSTIHDWSKCNYAHRQQDFRRPPYLFFYYPERCPHIGEDGSWENCENELYCDYAHTLVEILFNPLHYKLSDCVEKTSADKYKCAKHKERCCHAHSNEEKKLCNQVIEQLVPKVLPQKEDIMQYYLEMLPEYQQSPVNASKNTTMTPSDYDDEETGGIASAGKSSTLATTASIKNMNNSGGTIDQDQLSQMMPLVAKKPKDATKAAANLQKASDLQRQKFMDVFQQMQSSPAALAQKTYKVKSESKQQQQAQVQQSQSALLRSENPFSKVKQVAISPLDDSPQDSPDQVPGDFRPFDSLALASTQLRSADKQQPAMFFEKIDKNTTIEPSSSTVEIPGNPVQQQIKTLATKVDKRMLRKKNGRLVKGVTYAAVTQSAVSGADGVIKMEEDNSNVTTPEKERKPFTHHRNNNSVTSLQQLSSNHHLLNSQSVASQGLMPDYSPHLHKTQSLMDKAAKVPPSHHIFEETKGSPRSLQRNKHNDVDQQRRESATDTRQEQPSYLWERASQHSNLHQDPHMMTLLNNKDGQSKQSTKHNYTANSRQATPQMHERLGSQASSATGSAVSTNKSNKQASKYHMRQQSNTSTTLAAATSGRSKNIRQKNHNSSQISSARLKRGNSEALGTMRALPVGIASGNEFADYELPPSAKQSAEADIQMVKLQLLKHQMQSLQLSQEDSDNFYLQQISQSRESNKEISTQQSLVPLLSSRSSSPVSDSQDNEEEEKDEEEEVIEESKSGFNTQLVPNLRSATRLKSNAAYDVQNSKQIASNKPSSQLQQQQLPSESQQPSPPPVTTLPQQSIPEPIRVYKQLASGFSAIEVADFFEAGSMRLIALGFAELRGGKKMQHNIQRRSASARATTDGAEQRMQQESEQNKTMVKSRPMSAVEEDKVAHLPAHGGQRKNEAENCDRVDTQQQDHQERNNIETQRAHIVSGLNQQSLVQQQKQVGVLQPPSSSFKQQHVAANKMENSYFSEDIGNSGVLSQAKLFTMPGPMSALTMSMSQLPDNYNHSSGSALQVTHNRLLGSVRRGQQSWLYAFNWSLFADPILVWNASEVCESAAVWRSPTSNRQWLISSGSEGRLQAIDPVQPIIRHIWGLPLAMSEGFEEYQPSSNMFATATAPAAFNSYATTIQNNISQQQAQQQLRLNAGGIMPPAFVPSSAAASDTNNNNAAAPADSPTKQGAFRATNPQIYKKGKKQHSKNSNIQATFQSSNLSEYNKA